MKKPLTIRADEPDLERWNEAAGRARLSISEWARRGLNGYAEGVKISATAVGVVGDSPAGVSGGQADEQPVTEVRVVEAREEKAGGRSVRRGGPAPKAKSKTARRDREV